MTLPEDFVEPRDPDDEREVESTYAQALRWEMEEREREAAALAAYESIEAEGERWERAFAALEGHWSSRLRWDDRGFIDDREHTHLYEQPERQPGYEPGSAA